VSVVLACQHTRSRLAFLGKDTLTVHIDHRVVYRGHPRYPKNIGLGLGAADGGSEQLTYCSVGDGFDGQMATIYMFGEPVTQVRRSTTSLLVATRDFSV
jgi:hypothetical protein